MVVRMTLRAQADSAESSAAGSQRRTTALLLLVLAAGASLRLAYAWGAAGIFHPDEIHQSLEVAHGVVYGVGFRSWEFGSGARPWTTAGVYVVLLGILKRLGLDTPEGYLPPVRVFNALIAATWPWFCFRIGRALRSVRAGLLAAVLVASWYFLVLLAPRAFNHAFSVTFALWALARLLEPAPDRGRRIRTVLTGALLGLAFAFRYQDGLVAVGAALFLLGERRARELPDLLAGAAVPFLGVGLLDALTWGVPFHSLFAYLDANVMQGAAGRFGAMPAWFYAVEVPAALGLGALWFLLLPLAGPRAWRLLVAVGGTVLVAHSLTENKQLRFVLPAIMVSFCALGCGADALLDRLRSRRGMAAAVTAVLLALWGGASASRAAGLTFASLGIFAGQPETVESPWNFRADLDRALAEIGRHDDLCGLVIYPQGGAAGSARLATTGGYTYLHRAVPMSMGPLLPEAEAFTNYALACSDAQGRVMNLPGFDRLGRLGRCLVLRRPAMSCDGAATERFLASVRW